MNTSSRPTEFGIIARSLLLLIGLTLVIWIPLKLAVVAQHHEAATWRTSGRAIETSKLEKYAEASDRAFLLSVGVALVISQSAIWLVTLTRKDDDSPQAGAHSHGG